MIKNIDGISKTQHSINNLIEHQKYRTRFVIFDAESNFEHIYPVFTPLSFFSFVFRPWSSWTAYNDKKYLELNEAALNVNKPCVTSRKTAFPKDK